ncbi:type VI secretion system Vgr family protein [Ramlibacter albus]|uniref:Type VI secretion system tip protein VgrG n=1 Tax=Ramlibacter albus TaxID=2079448 RepID=A0A923S4U6_9BURK|nr:type VI secretion system tip protein TssI/VgrG [Ramlibacter albus]MBC5764497.1 type VI secretion system tip protein VgrG [Ramlibacter albus]
MKEGFKQAGFLKVTTPFGADDLLLDAMEGSEGLSELFRFNLHMRSSSTTLAASSIIGKPVTVKMAITGGPTRYINGICSRFVHSGFDRDFAHYEAEIVPKLWLGTLYRDRKIYQGKTLVEIIKAVLGDVGVTFDVTKVSGTYTALDYCVQYDETAFDFVSRLMERAGIFYFFKFADGAHTMWLGDSSSAFVDNTDSKAMRFFPQTGMESPIDTVSRFAHEYSVVLKTAKANDYDFENPSTALEGSHSASAGEGSLYEFGTGHKAASGGTALAKVRVEASQVTSEVLRGDSFAYPFCAGTKFTLSGHFKTALNASFVLRRVHHTARDELYTNSFEAFPAATPFRPPLLTLKPRAAGCETALVVGPSGEEIWTDKHGRIKVQFPWDRDGKKDDKASFWIRVQQSVAGKSFGNIFIPRIGQEVVITYINGDPERPLVTGSVYNGENTVPETLPANQTMSIIRTRSSKQGSAGNEIKLEDKKDSELFYMHAQKDMTREIENALTTTIKKGAETHTLEEGDHTFEIKKGKEIHKVKTTRETTIEGDETLTDKGKFTQTVAKDYSLKVDGKLTIEATGDITIKSSGKVNIESGTSFLGKSGSDMTMQAGTALTAKSGTDLKAEGGTNATVKGAIKLALEGGAQMDGKAPMVKIAADGLGNFEAGGMLTLKGALTKIN